MYVLLQYSSDFCTQSVRNNLEKFEEAKVLSRGTEFFYKLLLHMNIVYNFINH